VTHAMGLVSITNKFYKTQFHATNPSFGEFLVCDVSCPIGNSLRGRPKYRVITHSREVRLAEETATSNLKRATSCPAVEPLADRPRRPADRPRRPSLSPVQESSGSDRRPTLPLSARRGIRQKLQLNLTISSSCDMNANEKEDRKSTADASRCKPYSGSEASPQGQACRGA
jgi:hypothetical protein